MTRQEKRDRLEFLNTMKSMLTKTQALYSVEANQLAGIIFGKKYDLQNRRDVSELLNEIDKQISEILQPQSFLHISGTIETLTLLGAGQIVTNMLPKTGTEGLKYTSLATELANSYINRVGEDGLRLSQRIWGTDDIKSIYEEVYKSIKNGDSNFALAQNIEKAVSSGVPYSNIKRVADTEMTYAYTNAKADIAKREADEFGLETRVKVSLSPLHAIYDICDELKGDYPLDIAPIPPFHPRCHCLYTTYTTKK